MVSGGVEAGRGAGRTGAGVHIIVTTKHKGVSDGGGMNIYPAVQRGLTQMIEDENHDEETKEISFEDNENVLEIKKENIVKSRTKKKKIDTNKEERGKISPDATGDLPEKKDRIVNSITHYSLR